jgi:hypothetical protein
VADVMTVVVFNNLAFQNLFYDQLNNYKNKYLHEKN